MQKKYWGNKFAASGVSPKWVKCKRRRKKEEERLNDGKNNGQATHGARKHAWRTQAAWANFLEKSFSPGVYVVLLSNYVNVTCITLNTTAVA